MQTYQFKNFEPKGSHEYLLDANILIYLFAAIVNEKLDYQKTLGSFFDNCKRVNATLFVTSHILSEFFHVCLHHYFDEWQAAKMENRKYSLKRDYRGTEDYRLSVDSINDQIKGILHVTSRLNDSFEHCETQSLLKMTANCEFNDALLLELANRKNLCLVTNDADHINHPLRNCNILTF